MTLILLNAVDRLNIKLDHILSLNMPELPTMAQITRTLRAKALFL